MKMRTSMIAIVSIILVFIFIVISATTASAIPCECGDICVNTSGWWRDGGAFNASSTPIQHAINNATEGETICVRAGTYIENVKVNKSSTIRSENGSAVTTVQTLNSNDHVFNLTADYVNISGFTVTGATGFSAGIYLSSVNHCNISDNSAEHNKDGIYLPFSSNNTLMNNIANSNNRYGIYLRSASNNTLTNNTASDNNGYGIYLSSSSSNLIYNNYFNNTNNVYDDGNNLWSTTKTNGVNVIGGPWLGGNYWSDYAGEDLDGDGLGDSLLPYNSSGNVQKGGDYLPLIKAVAKPSIPGFKAISAIGGIAVCC